jgi:hypothetical protein
MLRNAHISGISRASDEDIRMCIQNVFDVSLIDPMAAFPPPAGLYFTGAKAGQQGRGASRHNIFITHCKMP